MNIRFKPKVQLLFVSVFAVFLSSCKKEETDRSACEQPVVVSKVSYNNAPNDPVSITDMKINGDCLSITFTASGCDGKSWTVELIDSEAIAKSNPPQRTLRLSLKNEELCDAMITKTMSFDIKVLRVQETGKVWLNVMDKGILYEY